MRAIALHARHPLPRVRSAVALACAEFAEALAEETLASLRKDSDVYVRGDALAVSQKRALRRDAGKKTEAHATAYSKLLAQIEAEHGVPAKRLAERTSSHRLEFFTGQTLHEIKNVLAAARRSLDVAQTERRKASGDTALVDRSIVRAGELLYGATQIMDAMSRYTRADEPDLREENLRDVVSEAHRTLALGMDGGLTDREFSNDVPSDLVAEIDRRALLQAVQNLIKNAVEAFPAGRERQVTVRGRCERDGAVVVLEIVDTGVGIASEDIDAIFRFRSSKQPGRGFGMPTAKKMIEETHGGKLDVASELGRGTTMRITIPTRLGSSATPARPKPRTRKGRT